jgi:hypothetical protein
MDTRTHTRETMLSQQQRAGFKLPFRSRWWVCTSREMRALILRNREKLLPGCNYVCEWNDTHGYGIHLDVCNWVAPGGTYFVPD